MNQSRESQRTVEPRKTEDGLCLGLRSDRSRTQDRRPLSSDLLFPSAYVTIFESEAADSLSARRMGRAERPVRDNRL